MDGYVSHVIVPIAIPSRVLTLLCGTLRALIRGTIWLRRPPQYPAVETACPPVYARVPSDVYDRIASLLSKRDLRNFVLTCKALHDTGGVILYRALDVRHRDARRCLSALLLRLQIHCATHIRFPPILFLRKLKFTGIGPVEDIRILPLLCDVLVNARQLRYLHIELHPQSTPYFLTLLKRLSISRVSTAGVACAFELALRRRVACNLTLPRLQVLRGSSCEVLGEIGAYRSLHSLVITGIPTRREVITLFEQLSCAAISHSLVALTCGVSCDDVPGFVRCVASVFPRLEFLNVVSVAYPPYDGQHAILITEVRGCA